MYKDSTMSTRTQNYCPWYSAEHCRQWMNNHHNYWDMGVIAHKCLLIMPIWWNLWSPVLALNTSRIYLDRLCTCAHSKNCKTSTNIHVGNVALVNIPYSGKLSSFWVIFIYIAKNFHELETELDFGEKSFVYLHSRPITCGHDMPQYFAEKTFADGQISTKFTKVFSHNIWHCKLQYMERSTLKWL